MIFLQESATVFHLHPFLLRICFESYTQLNVLRRVACPFDAQYVCVIEFDGNNKICIQWFPYAFVAKQFSLHTSAARTSLLLFPQQLSAFLSVLVSAGLSVLSIFVLSCGVQLPPVLVAFLYFFLHFVLYPYQGSEG